MTLRLTHLSRRLDACPWDLDDVGWFLRFTGDADEWEFLKRYLKNAGRQHARWIPGYAWDDGKRGAWWAGDDIFCSKYVEDQFSNPGLAEHAIELLDDEELQITWKHTRYGWSTNFYRPFKRQEDSFTQEHVNLVPAWLKQDFALLELTSIVTLQDCKNAYRRLSKVHHPDAGGTHEGFIQLQKAYNRVAQWVELSERIAV